jgi:hypothetical protein
MALDTTISGANADSYITIATCNTYHNARLHNSDWFDASTDTRERALRWATKNLDNLVWLGTIATDTQSLMWPRSGVYNPYGVELASDEIPRWLEDAVAEYAWELIKADRQVDSENMGITQVMAGEVMVKFDKNDRKSKMPATVSSLVRPYLSLTGLSSLNFGTTIRV